MATLSHAASGAKHRPASYSGLKGWITTVDHKKIGILYFWSALFFFLVGGVEAFLIRLQLAVPGNTLLSAQTYNQVFTMHAVTMIFMAVMPMFAAFANYLMPIMVGARDVAFPRLNAFSFWIFLAGAIFTNSSWFLGGAPNAGWFAYANITGNAFNPGPGMDFYALGVQLMGVGTLVSGFNFIVTILNLRAPGMSMMRLPLFVWTTLVTSVLVIFSFPALTVNLFLLTFDRMFGTNFFVASAGANVVMWQHFFWIFGHPEVYILILPAFGIVSEILTVFSEKPLFGYSSMVFAIIGIGFLAFMVWSHHMFSVGQGPVVNSIFSMTTMAIAVPTGVKIFNWLATLWGGRIRFSTAMLFAVGLIAMFTIGGMSGVMHAAAPSDFQQTDTYFVVAHIHYVLVGGALLAIFGAIYYWFPKMFGKMLSETLGKWNFWLVLIGFNVTFFPFHFLGLMGMPRRIYTYDTNLGVNLWNLVATVGVFILTLGVLVFLANLWISLRSSEKAPADPWNGRTLEWTIASPPPAYNFAVVPQVRGRDAFWLEKQAKGAAKGKVEKGSKAGHHGIHMPLPSWMPALIALATLVLAYGLIIARDSKTTGYLVAILGGLGTVLSVYGWVFEGSEGTVVEPEGDA